MKYAVSFLIGISIISKCTFAQTTDTIIGYNIGTHIIDTILPVAVNNNQIFAHTNSTIGSLGN